MKRIWIKAVLLGTCAATIATGSWAETFNIPGGDLKSALDVYTRTTGAALIVSDDLIAGARTHGVQGALPASEALGAILKGTGFKAQRTPSGAIGIVRGQEAARIEIRNDLQFAQTTPARTAVETVTVTSSKLGGADVQSIPISITALSQEQLTASQTNGGPDLIKSVPNMTFTKTNFSGYSIQIRGIGT
ncbi:MAG TPA: secretin and TonB N-terminal domain-containing protein, partial [Rhizomicrobium sp.]|nr:secretin and TonB N-terminal domain-containing protein [Rhizomicrobium sp.]